MLAHVRGLVEDFATEVAAKDIMISVDIGNLAINASMNHGKAVGHKADLNFGDCFAYACERATAMYTLIGTARLNDVNPEAWLTDVLARIADGHPIQPNR